MLKILFIFILVFNILFAENKSVNFKDISISQLINITSKVLNKNILVSNDINEKIDFISNEDLSKEELFELLKTVLNENNFDIIYKKGFYIVKKKDYINKKVIKTINVKNIEASLIVDVIKKLIPKNKLGITTNDEINSVVLYGYKDEIKVIEDLVKEMDVQKIQVFVKTKIIEINNEMIDNIGVGYGIFSAKSTSNDLITFSSRLNGGSNSFNDVNSILNISIPNITSGLALGASLNLLKQEGALNIISQPSILAINNQESEIYIGQTISVKTSFSLSDGGTSSENYKREDVGLTLKVKPRVSSLNRVSLDIFSILEGVKTTQTSSGNADTSKKKIDTTVVLNNGESVIIGGLTEKIDEITIQKVPLLGDIPLIGKVFSNKNKKISKSDLLIIATPYIIPTSKDITFINNEISKIKYLENEFLKNSLKKFKKVNK